MNSTIELYDVEPFWNFDFPVKICLSISIFFILGFGIIVHTQLIRFLRYKQNRLVNVIIYKNLTLQNLTYPPLLVFTLLEIWVHNPGLYIGYIGCYGFLFTRNFMFFHDAAHSLFINFFRYLCIVKADCLSEHNIQPRVSLSYHSSEIRGLCLMKCSSEMLQNLLYF